MEKNIPVGDDAPTVLVYTDGSARFSEDGLNCGAYGATVVFPDGRKLPVCGVCSGTKLGRMELTAVIAGLHFVDEQLQKMREIPSFWRVKIITDSTYVRDCAVGKSNRERNKDLWFQFDYLAGRFAEVSMNYEGRNSLPEQAQADALCLMMRRHFEEKLQEVITTPAFQQLRMKRPN